MSCSRLFYDPHAEGHAQVTDRAGQVPDPVTLPYEGVTAPDAAPAPRVTQDTRWMILTAELMECRKEVQGVMAGCDAFSFLSDFPDTHISVNDALHDLRRALLHFEEAIANTTRRKPTP